MATFVFRDGSVVINAVDLSDHVRNVTINYSAEMTDATAMGATTRINNGGLKNWSIDVEFLQDYAASEVDATLFALVGSTFTITVKPTSAAVSAANPSYSGTGIIESYAPVGGSVGDQATTTVTIQAAGTLARATV